MDEPPPITIRTPSSNKINIVGMSQNFFLAIKNLKRSFRKSIYQFVQFIESNQELILKVTKKNKKMLIQTGR